MILSDLIYNDDVDFNCNFEVYLGEWHNGTLLWSTSKNGWSRPPCSLLDKFVKYVTINVNTMAIVIEIEED